MKLLRYVNRKIAMVLHWWRYRGSNLSCPFCLRTADHFINSKPSTGQAIIEKYHIISMGARENYKCPWCGSTDKERLVLAGMEKMSLPLSEFSILHVAPEKKLSEWIVSYRPTMYIRGDKFSGDERYHDGRYGDAVNLDVTAIPFEDDTFDLVICNHVLEHVEKDIQAMSEIYRVLKPKGIAILQVPISPITKTKEDFTKQTREERDEAFGQVDHVRMYGVDYVERLTSVGFSVEVIPASSFDKRYVINHRESLFVAKKMPLFNND